MQRACFSRLDCCNLPSAIVPKAVEFALRLSHIGRQLTLAPVVHISERDGSHNLARRHRRRGSFSAGVGSQIFQENTRRKPTADAGTFQVSGLVEGPARPGPARRRPPPPRPTIEPTPRI